MNQYQVSKIREDFPALGQRVYEKPLAYLDNAATTLKPRQVVERMSEFYLKEASNVHRGAHYLSDLATNAFESARETVARFIGSTNAKEIVFTRGTTEGVNLLATTLGETLSPGDEVLLTEMEHHSNLVPWQVMAKKKQVTLKFVEVTPSGELDLNSFRGQLSSKTKIVSFVHCSNALGTINPAKLIIEEAKRAGALTVVDAAQSVSFLPMDVQGLGCDFLVYSGHKLFGPFGIGVLWGRLDLLDRLPPYQSGGSMIDRVRLQETSFLTSPHRFEAGTPNVGGAIGLARAIDYFTGLDIESVQRHESELAEMARNDLRQIDGLRLIGSAENRGNIVSFVFDGIHPSDIGQILDREGLAVRTGHHCTQPLMDRLGIPGTVRASFSIYNTEGEVRRLVEAARKAREFFV
ncbi:MAG: cysteine desulfurase [Bdellovibrionaceae bacterium]|nr:cysteine desulfurase [Bdellovibrionales bacterium]MCB9085298.1 cysteine desulfurase [Pseudobdellovibrionaceae bacterium]